MTSNTSDTTDISFPLNNTGWNALSGLQSQFALSNGRAKRFMPDVSILAALSENTDAAFDDLAELVSIGEVVGIDFWQLPTHVPSDWTVLDSFTIKRMISIGPVSEPEIDQEIVTLTASDVPEMLQLVKLTEPGPFGSRTIELGHYVGIRHHGSLVAMAGERRHLVGYRELSAVCTHPDHRGKGYARRLTAQLVNENWRRGDIPFLGVTGHNDGAFQMYQKLNFQWRGEFQVLVLRR